MSVSHSVPLAGRPTGLVVGFVLAVLPSAAQAAGDFEAGREKARACAVCHGMDGLSKRPDAPNLAGQNDFYMATQLQHYRAGRRKHEVMAVIAQDLSDQDIDDLVRYYSGIEITVKVPE